MRKSLFVLFIGLCLLLAIPVVPQLGQAQSRVVGSRSEPAARTDQLQPAGDGLLGENAYITADVLISRAEDRQSYPDVAYNDDDNEWLVVWQDKRGGTWDIQGQRVNAAGVIQGEVLDIGSGEDNYQYPAVAYDTTQERYLVVWQNSTNSGIHGRVLDADGTHLSPVVIITSGAKSRRMPDIAYNPASDEYLVVWEYEEAAGNHDIYGRKVGVGGVVDPGGEYAISALAADEVEPALMAYPTTSASAGRYLLVFSTDNPGHYNVAGRRLLPNGTPAGAAFPISTGTDEGTGDEYRPSVTLDTSEPGGLALVVWESNPVVGDQDIVGRLVDITMSGADVLGDWLVIEGSERDQQYPAVTYNGVEDEYVVVWDDNLDMFGSRVEPDVSGASEAFAICDETNSQRYGAVAFGADRALVAWTDYRAPFADIMGQRLSQTGSLLGPEIGLSVFVGEQWWPELAYGTQQREWLVIWEHWTSHGGHRQIWGQFVGHDGLLRGEPLAITGNVANVGQEIAYNPDDDEFLIVWHDYNGDNNDIWGQRVSAAGRTLAGSAIQITTDPDDQYGPDVAYNSVDGLYLVAWEDLRDSPAAGPTNRNIYGRRLNGDGTFADGDDFVICARPDNQDHAEMAFNPVDGLWLVTWTDYMDPGRGISGQRVGVGNPPLVGNVIDIHRVEDEARGPKTVACNTKRGVWLVVWEDYRNLHTNEIDLYGRRVNGEGNLLGSADIVVSDAPANQMNPNIAYDPSLNRYVVVWEDYRFGEDGDTGPDIVGQTLSANGSLLFTESNANAPVWVFVADQRSPAIAGDPADGRGLVVWDDRRSEGDNPQIYGRLGDPEASLIEVRVFLPVVLRDH